MSDGGTLFEPLAVVLDRRAAVLARLLESHPALDLLAEYEAVFLDRQPCADRPTGDIAVSARDLLARIERAIVALDREAAT